MFNVNGQLFETKKEALSYAKTASSFLEGIFTVTLNGEVLATLSGGRVKNNAYRTEARRG